MNTWQSLIIVLFSSGTVATLISAISKKKDREHTTHIKEVVEETMKNLTDDIKDMKKSQGEMTKALGILTEDLKDLKEDLQNLTEDVRDLEEKFLSTDLLFIKKLREKGVLNGESDELYTHLLGYNNGGLISASKGKKNARQRDK